MPGVIVIHIDIETDIRSFLSIVKSFQSCPFFAIIHILYSDSFFNVTHRLLLPSLLRAGHYVVSRWFLHHS